MTDHDAHFEHIVTAPIQASPTYATITVVANGYIVQVQPGARPSDPPPLGGAPEAVESWLYAQKEAATRRQARTYVALTWDQAMNILHEALSTHAVPPVFAEVLDVDDPR